jgi:hypothetical protein
MRPLLAPWLSFAKSVGPVSAHARGTGLNSAPAEVDETRMLEASTALGRARGGSLLGGRMQNARKAAR